MTQQYPDTFYIAHKWFSRYDEWGDICDGPVTDFAHVVTLIYDQFDGNPPPTPQTLRVWYIEPGQPASNVTAAAIAAVLDRMDALDE